jgi:chaperone LolA
VKRQAQRHKGTKAQSNLFLFFVVFSLLLTPYSLLTVSAADNEDHTVKSDVAAGSKSDEKLSGIVDGIQKKLAGIRDIKGIFIQNSYIKDLDQKQKYSGSFFIKKPSRVMWEYSSPRDEKVLIRETDTQIYKKSQNQLIKMKFSKDDYNQVPIALLESLENIWKDFDASLTQGKALQLIPKRKTGSIKTIVLETASDDFPLKMFTIFDTYGNIIMIELDNLETNSGLDDSLFILKTPEDVEVFDMGE